MLKNTSSRILTAIFLCLAFSGCFDNADTSKKDSSSISTDEVSSITQFKGAVSAFNRVSGIEIKWEESAVEPSLYRVYKLSGRKLNLIATLASGTNGFIDGDITWGATYSYIVRAVDKNGIEEKNDNAVTSLAWGGIASVLPTSRSSIKVSFDFGTPLIDEVRIYLTSKVTGVKTKVATLSGSELEANIENLRIGYSYKVSAQAYVNSLKKEDGNEVFFDVDTETEGFHDEDASLAKWRNIINVRAFGESLGTVAHPVTPEKVPRTRVIEVAFNSFTSKDSLTKYVVVRARVDYPLDTSTQTACTESKFSSCKVCEVTGLGTLFCRDTAVAAAPTKYRYTMAIIQEDAVTGEKWVEPLPQDKLDNYSILVPVPPDNMTLVQRDAVNYEMCQGMNRVSDPANHNRCPYAGVGAAPYSSGHNKPPLNLPKNYYDYGYNLFVDRYPLACNWTPSAYGGKCGAGATNGDCIGTVAPTNTIGVEGNVYWQIDNITNTYKSYCLVKRDNVWMRYDTMLATKANNQSYLQTMFTNDPAQNGGKRPVISSYMGPNNGTEVCKSFSDINYGAKRLPRMREYRAFTAFPTLSNEPYAMTYAKALTTRYTLNTHDATNGFNCDFGVGDNYPASLIDMLSPANELASFDDGSIQKYGQGKFFQGAKATADCQSRYGIQINMSAYRFIVNDYIYFDVSNKRYTGAASPVDNGNRDLLTDLNGGQTGFRMDITTPVIAGDALTTYLYLGSTGFVNYVILPLGLPVMQATSSEYLPKNLFLEKYSDIQYTYLTNQSSASKAMSLTSRWETNYQSDYSSNGGGIFARCVLPAD